MDGKGESKMNILHETWGRWRSQKNDVEVYKYAYTGKTQAEQSAHWIEVAAYYLWIEEGCPEGRDRDHWQKACKLFIERPDNQ